MDKRQFSLTDPPPTDDSDSKLVRSYSLSNLPSSKVTITERFHSQTCDEENLVKQFSCEAIIDDQANKSQYTVSRLFKTKNQEHLNIWKKELPTNSIKPRILTSMSNWSKERESLPWLQSNLSLSTQRLSLADVDDDSSRKNFEPPKLSVADKESQQSISNSQSSQNSFQSSLSNLSRYESGDDSFSFKKPLTLSKQQPTVLKKRFVTKDKKVDDDKIEKKDFTELTKTNNVENEENDKYENFNSRLRSLVAPNIEKEIKKQSRLHTYWKIVFVMFLLVAILCLLAILGDADLLNKLCDPHFEINSIPQELSRFLHGQSSAVIELSKFFTRLDNKASFNILVLIGGIGVGKSYTSEIIRSNLKETTDALDFFSPLYTKENQAYSSLSICKCNLIRLENLRSDDIEDAVKFASVLKEKAKKHCILVLAIFNPEEIDHNLERNLNLDKSSSFIKSKFQEANLKPTIVNYVPLDDEALEKCIKDLADYANLELTGDDFENVKKSVKAAKSGCKTAYSKVQIAGKAVRDH